MTSNLKTYPCISCMPLAMQEYESEISRPSPWLYQYHLPLTYMQSTQFFQLDLKSILYLCFYLHLSTFAWACTISSTSHSHPMLQSHQIIFHLPFYLILSCLSSCLVRMSQVSSCLGNSFYMRVFVSFFSFSFSFFFFVRQKKIDIWD